MRGLTPLGLIERELALASRPCMTLSFQTEGVALAHMIRALAPDLPMLFVDTGHHFPETLAFAESLARAWRLNVVTLSAAEAKIGLWQYDLDACCARHKVRPLFAALTAYDCWFSGLRREQSRSRAHVQAVEPFVLPDGHELRKVSPLVDWTGADVARYLEAHDLPMLPLYAQGYTSIGCAPCTSRPIDPADPRSGRWGGRKLECGIHVSHESRSSDRATASVPSSIDSPAQ